MEEYVIKKLFRECIIKTPYLYNNSENVLSNRDVNVMPVGDELRFFDVTCCIRGYVV